jgi:hypothetical protein
MFESDFAGNLHSWNAGGINSLFNVKIKKRRIHGDFIIWWGAGR